VQIQGIATGEEQNQHTDGRPLCKYFWKIAVSLKVRFFWGGNLSIRVWQLGGINLLALGALCDLSDMGH
jgi:hypothetical protein